MKCSLRFGEYYTCDLQGERISWLSGNHYVGLTAGWLWELIAWLDGQSTVLISANYTEKNRPVSWEADSWSGGPNECGDTNVHCRLVVCLTVHRCICAEKKNQLDVTECFIALMICSTCFGHFYAYHQELETICVLPPMVCSAWLLVVGSQVQGSRLCVQEEACCTCNIPLPGYISSHPWHQPAPIPVNNIRCCKYSQVLLMMGEDIARNM